MAPTMILYFCAKQRNKFQNGRWNASGQSSILAASLNVRNVLCSIDSCTFYYCYASASILDSVSRSCQLSHSIGVRCFVSFRQPYRRCNHICTYRKYTIHTLPNARPWIELVLDLIVSAFPSFWWDTSELGRCSFYLSLKFVAVVLYSSSHQAILFVWTNNFREKKFEIAFVWGKETSRSQSFKSI